MKATTLVTKTLEPGEVLEQAVTAVLHHRAGEPIPEEA
jgi:hypothetical protein